MSNTRRDRYIRDAMHSRHANYLKEQQKYGAVQHHDKEMFSNGENWYVSGKKLEEADDKLQNNKNFLNGYMHAVRIAEANKEAYALGKDFFQRGVPLHQIPAIYANNSYFVRGYSDAINESLNDTKSYSKRR